MSKKQWFLLWLIFVGYLFLGATVFYYLERKVEIRQRHLEREEQLEIEDLLRQNYAIGAPMAQEQIMSRLTDYCGKPFSVPRQDFNESQFREDEVEHENEKPFSWNYYNSFFFALTTLSTIGYGNLSPKSMEGRMLVILYSLIGIPLNGIVLSHLGEFFGSTFLRAHHRYKTHRFETRLSLIMDIVMYLIPGIVFFIFIPSGAFVYFEGWSFDESVYYAFVTLTTIGYGDYVAGQTGKDKTWYNVYKVLLIIWFMFGLGYLVMILGFIARAMRSKKMARLEHAVSATIKQTQAKIWQELTSEVTSVRRMINEMYFMKIKPVYRDKEKTSPLLGTRPRSRSAPHLTEWPVLRKKEPEPEPEDLEAAFQAASHRNRRRRAISENVMHEKPKRVMSDGEINRIDLTATFRSATPSEPGMLLARVIDAIGTPLPSKSGPLSTSSDSEEEDMSRKVNGGFMNGINMFSDSEILASEWGDGIRKRTLSEVLAIPASYSYDEQQTWSGTDYNKFKQKHSLSQDPMPNKTEPKSQSDHFPTPASGLRRMSMAAINFFTPANKWGKKTPVKSLSEEETTKPKDRKPSHPKEKKRRTGNSNILLSQAYLQKHRYSLQDDDFERGSFMDEINYLSCTAGRRPSILATLAQELGPKRDSSSSISPVLEQTSVADFIRVLSSLQSRLENSELNLEHVASNGGKHSNQSSPYNFTSTRTSPLRQSQTKKEKSHSTSAISETDQAEAINPALVERGEMKRRRFSFIPHMDKFPFGKAPSEENMSLYQKKSRSHSITPSNSVGNSNTNLSRQPINKRIRRMSSAGLNIKQFRKSSQPKNQPILQHAITPPKLVITSPEGYEKPEVDRFTVTQTEMAPSSRKQSSSSGASVSWGTAASHEVDELNDKDSSENLEDVVILRL